MKDHPLALLTMTVMVMVSGCFTPVEPSATSTQDDVTAEAATPRKTIGKTTQNVLSLKAAVADGGVLAESTTGGGANPLMPAVGAYGKSVSKIATMQISQAIQLRNAQSIKRPQPLTHPQFMDEILKPGQPDGIRLPMLPYYQEYAWDEPNQTLTVVNFPARQAERERQR